MGEYKKILKAIKENKLKLYFLFSIPRSRSTALQLCLAQASEIDGQINTPMCEVVFARPQNSSFQFNDFRDSIVSIPFEDIASKINKAINKAQTTTLSPTFIIHEHFNYLAPEYLPILSKLGEQFIFSIRHPKIQFLSYLLRFCNTLFLETDNQTKKEKFFGENILDFLSCQDLSLLNQNIQQIIKKNNIKIYSGDLWYRFTNGHETSIDTDNLASIFNKMVVFAQKNLQVMWENALYTLNYFNKCLKKINIAIVDGELLANNPYVTLNLVTSKTNGLTFNIDMINNWNKSTGDKFICHANDEAWNGPSRNSHGITTKNDCTSNLSLNPKILTKEFAIIFEQATTIYQRLLAWSATNL